MAAINRVGSPMHYIEESLEESRDELDKKIQKLKKRQNSKSPFLVGSIDDVSKRVSRLDRKLQRYTELIAESRASEYPAEDEETQKEKIAASARVQERLAREKDAKEATQFAGLYAIKSTLGLESTEKLKNVSKVSISQSKTSQSTKKETNNKPKFVELHQYPGYEAHELTPLPSDIHSRQILEKVTSAQKDLRKKASYRQIFTKLFSSHMSQAILVDSFWWYFLEKFQKNPHVQQKLFNRIAHNYVKLIIQPEMKEAFLQSYPSLLAQSVYASFCAAFPDSYRQFNDDFKENLHCVISLWVVGLKPAPKSWKKWNVDGLEPANIKVREEMMQNKNKPSKKSSTTINFDLDIPSHHSSQTTLNSNRSTSSKPSSTHLSITVPQQVPRGILCNRRDKDEIETVADAQSCSQKRVLLRSRGQEFDEIQQHEETDSHNVTNTKKKHNRKSDEFWNSAFKKKRESHPACKGPDFTKLVFNINGQSPLVAQFLRMKNLRQQSGCDVKIQRTEIHNLPPEDSRTYMDLIQESFHDVSRRSKDFEQMYENGKKEWGSYLRDYHRQQKDKMARETAFLANPREVKRISNLIILEQRKDQDSVTAGADIALEAALMAQE